MTTETKRLRDLFIKNFLTIKIIKLLRSPGSAFWIALSVALLLRVYNLQIPFLEPYNSLSRQSISASIVRNFYENGFHFMNPEINENGRGPYLFNGEMPIYAYLMALGYKLAGGCYEWVSRLVSVFFSMGAIWFIGLIARKLYDEPTAIVAILFAACSPLNLALSRAIQPESFMIMSSTAALCYMIKHLEKGALAPFLISLIMMFIAIGTKFYNVYIFLPIFFYVYQKKGFSLFKKPKYYLYVVAASSALLWYVYMMHMGRTHHLAYIIYKFVDTRGPSDKTFLQLLFSPAHDLFMAKVFFLQILTPLGAILFLVGLFSIFKKGESNRFAYAWLFFSALLVLVFWRTAIDHAYYQLPLVPASSLIVARGALRCWEVIQKNIVLKRAWLIWVFAAAVELVFLGHYYRGIYFVPEKMLSIVEAGRVAQTLIPKQSLIVASYGASPIQLYYCDRKGWTFNLNTSLDSELIDPFQKLREEGAEYFVVAGMDQIHNKPLFERFLRGHYFVLRETSDFILFDLRTKPS